MHHVSDGAQAPGGQIFAASAGAGANGTVHLAVANASGAARLGSDVVLRYVM